MVLMFKMILRPGVFFTFSKCWFSGLLGGGGGNRAKNSPKWQTMSVVLNISGYIIWSLFVVHMCKMIISPGVFFYYHYYFFKVLIFWVVRRVKGQKWPKMTKNSVLCTLYLRNHASYDLDLWYTCYTKNNPKWQNDSNSISAELFFIWLWLLVHMCKLMISPAFFFFFHFFKVIFFRFFKVHQ